MSKALEKCGFYVVTPRRSREYIPLLNVHAHTTIFANSSRTTLTQTFQNPLKDQKLEELNYVFPLYEGVSVVSFKCTVADRVIHGVVTERAKAKKVYDDAKKKGSLAALLERSKDAGDVFSTQVGNVPEGELIKVEIEYLGELKHDAEADAVRLTIPTHIAPRYGEQQTMSGAENVQEKGGFSVTVDAEMPEGSAIKSVQSPSHPISVQIGTMSNAKSTDQPSLYKASASLSLGSTELDKDFILQVAATKLGEPSAVLETHPTIPNQRALMATLVPKFKLPPEKPEIVFVCDRSGSMGSINKIPNLVASMKVFLKSLPRGVRFNICSFGDKHEFLYHRSQTYDQETLDKAIKYVDTFTSNFGGTEIYRPLKETFEQRYSDMNLEVFLMTDGEIWDQANLFKLINDGVAESKGKIRIFTIGIGDDVSHALIEGAARCGNGKSQLVGNNEKMTKKVIRMLKGSLTPHVDDYRLEIKYESQGNEASKEEDDDFELIERVNEVLEISAKKQVSEASKKPISLYDSTTQGEGEDEEMPDAFSEAESRYDHLPQIDTPQYLQTPFQIPPLFPFNRSTVYVLLSDENAGRKPKSVILKGTCSHGPLELEIPIQHLAEKGETIHQLAARNAVKDFEEGRGWIFHAKHKESGKLLKDEFEGRFSDMVEREAVRLGIQFGVGGRWCSFVAVAEEDQGQQPAVTAGERNIPEEQTKKRKASSAPGTGPRIAAMDRIKEKKPTKGMAPAPTPISRAAPAAASAPRGLGNGGALRHRKIAVPVASEEEDECGEESDGARFLEGNSSEDSDDNNKPKRKRSTAFLDIQAEVDDAEDGGYSACSPIADDAVEDMGFGAYSPPANADPQFDSVSETDDEMGYGLFDGPSIPIPPPAESKEDPMEKLASLQSFSGSWTWSEGLEKTIGASEDAAGRAAQAAGLDSGKRDVLATVCAVIYLAKKQADEEEAWEMFVEKAKEWLAEQVGEDEVEKWTSAVEGLF